MPFALATVFKMAIIAACIWLAAKIYKNMGPQNSNCNNFKNTGMRTKSQLKDDIATTGVYISSSKIVLESLEVAVIQSTSHCRLYSKHASPMSKGGQYYIRTMPLLSVLTRFKEKGWLWHTAPQYFKKVKKLIAETKQIQPHKETTQTNLNKQAKTPATFLRLEQDLKENILYICSHEKFEETKELAVIHSSSLCNFYQTGSDSKSVFAGDYTKKPISLFEAAECLLTKWGTYFYSLEEQEVIRKLIEEASKIENKPLHFCPPPVKHTKKPVPLSPSKPINFDGYVYCLSNPAMPGLLKIGYTTNSPHYRAEQLFKDGGTGVPAPYQVEFYYQCMSPFNVEQEIHRALTDKRYQYNREFFQLSVNEAYEVFKTHVPEPRKRFA